MTQRDESIIPPTGHSQGWTVWIAHPGGRSTWAYSAWVQSEAEMGYAINETQARAFAERALARLTDKRRRETLRKVK